jgi:hypothetical protein
MKPILVPLSAVFCLALVPAGVVYAMFEPGPLVAFVVGSAAVAATIALPVSVARGRHWLLHLGLFVPTVGVVPFVAGGVTGLAVALASSEAGTVENGVSVGLTGAFLLYPFLVGAAVLAWGVGLGAMRLAERSRRTREVAVA